ncbi:hypothetical protein [Streptomyces sp. NPDC005898]|uniref:hypothetical protein n=1 Tax=Streptomyces sp. NPDC005898 TaxID=3157082 RepID=UPI0034033E88
MSMSETELLALLRELDDPERLEWPLNYDRAAASLAFGRLVRRLETEFGTRCEFEQDTQDASEYGRVRVPADATTCGTRIVVCVSKFGSLAEVCADNPGAFLGTEEAREGGALDLAKSDGWQLRGGHVLLDGGVVGQEVGDGGTDRTAADTMVTDEGGDGAAFQVRGAYVVGLRGRPGGAVTTLVAPPHRTSGVI